jgi:hypothetical protein
MQHLSVQRNYETLSRMMGMKQNEIDSVRSTPVCGKLWVCSQSQHQDRRQDKSGQESAVSGEEEPVPYPECTLYHESCPCIVCPWGIGCRVNQA